MAREIEKYVKSETLLTYQYVDMAKLEPLLSQQAGKILNNVVGVVSDTIPDRESARKLTTIEVGDKRLYVVYITVAFIGKVELRAFASKINEAAFRNLIEHGVLLPPIIMDFGMPTDLKPRQLAMLYAYTSNPAAATAAGFQLNQPI